MFNLTFNIMRKIYFVFALAAMVGSVTVTSCRTKKTVEQGVAMDRGKKQSKEECEELALKDVKELRASGNGVSPKESMAKNIALAEARRNLSAMITTAVEGYIEIYNGQHEAQKEIELTGQVKDMINNYTNNLLNGTVPICSNTYVKTDGDFNVYVCIEISSEKIMPSISKKISEETKQNIEFDAFLFKKEMEKAREEYKNR